MGSIKRKDVSQYKQFDFSKHLQDSVIGEERLHLKRNKTLSFWILFQLGSTPKGKTLLP